MDHKAKNFAGPVTFLEKIHGPSNQVLISYSGRAFLQTKKCQKQPPEVFYKKRCS